MYRSALTLGKMQKLFFTFLIFFFMKYVEAEYLSPGDYIDMSYSMKETSLFWPGLGGLEYPQKRGENVISYCASDHFGTHMDAPGHFSLGNWHVEEIPVHKFIGPAVKIDISRKAHPDYNLSVQDMEEWVSKHGPIPENAIIFIHTGWGKYIKAANRTAFFGYSGHDIPKSGPRYGFVHFPGVSEEAAAWMVKTKPVGVGIDGPSLGPAATMLGHIPLSENDIFVLEEVANLDKLPAKGSILLAFPLKLEDGSGATTRVVALTKNAELTPFGKKDTIDLTHGMNNHTVIWPPSDVEFSFKIMYRNYTTAGGTSRLIWSETNRYCSPLNSGTHLESPAQMSGGVNSISDIPIPNLIGQAVVVDITGKVKKDHNAQLSVSDLQNWENQNGRIPDNSILFVRTGWSKHYTNLTAYFGLHVDVPWNNGGIPNGSFPGVSEAAAKWIATNRKVSGVGIDAGSIDNGRSTVFSAQKALAAANIYSLKNINNLESVPVTSAMAFAFPINLEDAKSAPARVVILKKGLVIAQSHARATASSLDKVSPLLGVFLFLFSALF